MQKRREKLNWDDCRFVLSLARGGTMSAAARALGVDQTTVSRRLGALEDQLGVSLFIRTRGSCLPTEAGEILIAHAEVMESAALAISINVPEVAEQPQGDVRIASMPWIFSHLIVPALPTLRSRFPGISIQAIAGLRERHLGKREAEMSLRFEAEPRPQEVAIPIAEFDYSIYGPAGHDHDALPWVGIAEELLITAPQVWLEQTVGTREQIVFEANDAGIVYRSVRAGLGRGLIPDVLGRNDSRLQRLSDEGPEMRRQLRLLVHRDMLHVARVTAVINWLRDTALNQGAIPPRPS